jgi:hypothetical protein
MSESPILETALRKPDGQRPVRGVGESGAALTAEWQMLVRSPLEDARRLLVQTLWEKSDR